MSKLLTIAIPTFNRKKYLERTLNSILKQCSEVDTDKLEILVSDNCSDDGTEEMIKSGFSNVIYHCNEKNFGFNYNFLNCYKMATGKFVLLLGSDDILISGSLKRIMSFLCKNSECKVAFLNHGFFTGEYNNIDSCYNFWREIGDDFTTSNKKRAMDYIGRQITFMSCIIINISAYKRVCHPEQYMWTSFIHSNIWLECCKRKDDMIGIVGYPCIAQNVGFGDSEMDSSPEKSFEVFGKGMEYTLCRHAVECGFDRQQVRKIYVKTELLKWPGLIVYLKSANNQKWEKEFRTYGFPILKEYPVAFMATIPFILMPRFVAVFLRRYLRPMVRKIRGIKIEWSNI